MLCDGNAVSIQPWTRGSVPDFDLSNFAKPYNGYTHIELLLFAAELLPYYAVEAYELAARAVKSGTLNGPLLLSIREKQRRRRRSNELHYAVEVRLACNKLAPLAPSNFADSKLVEDGESMGDDEWLLTANHKRAYWFSALGHALQTAHAQGIKGLIRMAISDIGECHMASGNFRQALQIFEEALSYSFVPELAIGSCLCIMRAAALLGDHDKIIKAVTVARGCGNAASISSAQSDSKEIGGISKGRQTSDAQLRLVARYAGAAAMALGQYERAAREFAVFLCVGSEEPGNTETHGCDDELMQRTPSMAAAMEAATAAGSSGGVENSRWSDGDGGGSEGALLGDRTAGDHHLTAAAAELGAPLADAAVCMAFCTMASVKGYEQRSERNWRLQLHGELDSFIRETLRLFMERKYGAAFSHLASYRRESPQLELQLRHILDAAEKAVRQHGLALHVEPYSAVPLARISKRLSLSASDVRSELADMIGRGELHARLDIDDGVLYAAHTNTLEEACVVVSSCGEAVQRLARRVLLASALATATPTMKTSASGG